MHALPGAHAADWALLYASPDPYYQASLCRLRTLMLRNGMSSDNIVTIGRINEL